MTDPVDALEAADKARTPGPWCTELVGVMNAPRSYIVTPTGDSDQDRTDARFIALWGTHSTALIARLRAAEAVCEVVEKADTEGRMWRWPTFFAEEVLAVTDALAAWQATKGET